MKFKILLSIITIVSTSFSLSAVTYAEQVPWESIEYTASAKAEIVNLSEDFQESFGPPLPTVASAYAENGDFRASAFCRVDSSIINIDTWAYSCG